MAHRRRPWRRMRNHDRSGDPSRNPPPVGSATVASGTGDDIPASCGGKVPDGFSAEPRFALVLDDGGCLVVARELLLVQPYSREGFEALLADEGHWLIEVEPVVGVDPLSGEHFELPAPDVVLDENGVPALVHHRFLVRFDANVADLWLDEHNILADDLGPIPLDDPPGDAIRIARLVKGLVAVHGAKVLDATPVVIGGAKPAETDGDLAAAELGLSSNTYNCSCLDKSTSPPTYDALGTSNTADCDDHLATSGENLLCSLRSSPRC